MPKSCSGALEPRTERFQASQSQPESAKRHADRYAPRSMDAKEIAGRRAAAEAQPGMLLGLGKGSTVHWTLQALGERAARGERVRGVPTSLDTERKARQLGIEILRLDEVVALDLAIDGADEIDARFRMIKGGGGALLREKVVASLARRVVIVVGANKVVERLGTTFALPIEVVPFALAPVARRLALLGCDPKLRLGKDGLEYRTDNGNAILDCAFAHGIVDPERLERDIDAIPGVVESGLFLGLAHARVVGHDDGRCEVVEQA